MFTTWFFLVYLTNFAIAKWYMGSNQIMRHMQQLNNERKVRFQLQSGDFQLEDPFRTYTQKLDHFDPFSNETFTQRYVVNAKYYKRDGPIFLYVAGEWMLSSYSVEDGSYVDLAQKLNGLVVALEHRYYGSSVPFDGEVTLKQLKYLSSSQAIRDVVEFISALPLLPEFHSISKASYEKIILVGGSYPGNLVAWIKEKYPHLVLGAWSSSGPVLAKSDFWEYDDQITRVIGEKCASVFRNVTRWFEGVYESGDSERLTEAKILLHPSFKRDDAIDVLAIIANLMGGSIQYGDWKQIQTMCHSIDKVKTLADALARVSYYITSVLNHFNFQLQSMIVPTKRFQDDDHIPYSMFWDWQCCTEFGYWQTAPKRNPLRSKYLTESWHMKNYCQEPFGFDANYTVPFQMSNAVFGGRRVANYSEHIVFTNGANDPWSRLSVQATDLNSDKDDDSPSASATRKKVFAIIEKWLKK